MIEFDIDMSCFDEDELAEVILHDENGERDDIRYRRVVDR